MDKKIKSFNKIYRDLQLDVMKSFKRGNDKVYKIKREIQIETFINDIEKNKKLYESKDVELFERVFILKRVFSGKPKLNASNNEIAWKYIKVLYNLSIDKDLTVALLEPETPALSGEESNMLKNIGISPLQMKGLVDELTNGKNKGIQDLVKDLVSQLSPLGEDVSPVTIFNTIMNPDTREKNSLGIDFNKILKETQQKIASGEVDISGITERLSSLRS